MKTILTITFVTLAAIALFSCKDDTLDPEKPDGTVIFNVDPVGLTFGVADKDAQSIYVTTLNVEWKAEVEDSAQEWLKITEESQKIVVRVEENTTEQARTGKIRISTDNEVLSPKEIIVTQSFLETLRIPMTVGSARFYGESAVSGLGSYRLDLWGGDAWINEGTGVINTTTEGYCVTILIEAEEVVFQDYITAELKPGIYHAAANPTDEQEEYDKWIFIKTFHKVLSGGNLCMGSLLTEMKDGKVSEFIELADGRVIIEETDNDYSVRAEFVSDAGQRIVIDYPGPFDYLGRYDGPHDSRMKKDVDLGNSLIRGRLSFGGERVDSYLAGPDVPGCYFWVAEIITDVKFGVQLMLFSPMTDSLVLDSGVYKLDRKQELTEFTAEAGWYYQEVRAYPGCWYFEGTVLRSFTLVIGTITVKHNGGNNYTITIDAYSDWYSKFDATFDGELEYSGVYVNPWSVGSVSEYPGLFFTPQKTDQGPFPPVPER